MTLFCELLSEERGKGLQELPSGVQKISFPGSRFSIVSNPLNHYHNGILLRTFSKTCYIFVSSSAFTVKNFLIVPLGNSAKIFIYFYCKKDSYVPSGKGAGILICFYSKEFSDVPLR